MVYEVFLSHSGADGDWANWIYHHAKTVGISVYLFEHDAQPGVLLSDKIQQAIERSKALVVLLTLNSQFSTYVQQEIGFAEGKGKPIIPLVQSGTSEKSLAMLQGRDYIHFDLHNPDEALLRLLDYLQRLKEEADKDTLKGLMALGAIVFVAILASQAK